MDSWHEEVPSNRCPPGGTGNVPLDLHADLSSYRYWSVGMRKFLQVVVLRFHQRDMTHTCMQNFPHGDPLRHEEKSACMFSIENSL